jgi:hypothetical protein
MSEYEFTLSLRLRHPAIDPTKITQTLGIEPQHTWKAGDRRCPLSAPSQVLMFTSTGEQSANA